MHNKKENKSYKSQAFLFLFSSRREGDGGVSRGFRTAEGQASSIMIEIELALRRRPVGRIHRTRRIPASSNFKRTRAALSAQDKVLLTIVLKIMCGGSRKGKTRFDDDEELFFHINGPSAISGM